MNIWIVNHFASPPEFETRVRNNVMAKYLIQKGHNVKIISASTIHNTDINLMEGMKSKIMEREYEGLNFVHIRTINYKTNGFKRILNHLQFPIILMMNYKKVSSKPDVIISDLGVMFSIFAYFISRRTKASFVQEIRDLWPESIVEFMGLSRTNLLVKILYSIEKWIYKKSKAVIFSMEGGPQYINDKKWNHIIPENKTFHITNGVDIEQYKYNQQNYQLNDEDLNNVCSFKVIYTGAIRQANQINTIIDAAKEIKNRGITDIEIILYGDGPDREEMEDYCSSMGLTNIKFKGSVDKKYVPYILSKGNLNILHYKPSNTWKYGGSQNKLAEYIVSGKPTISTINMNYNPLLKFECGSVTKSASPEDIVDEILKYKNMSSFELDRLSENLKEAIENLDYRNLTNKLEKILLNLS